MAESPAVIVKRPVIYKTFNLNPPGLTPQPTRQTIPVPYAMWDRVELFMPPGTNYSVRVAFGYNGKRLLPSENANEYIIGAGFLHSYPVGIPVSGSVDVWFLQLNAFYHLITVALFMDYGPIEQAQKARALVTPR